MIKRLITVALFSALAVIHAAGQAQPNRFPPINLVAGDPTGTSCPAHSMVQSSDSGILYTCQGGAYHTAGGQTIPVTAVTWPPSCTTGTYVPATNTCVPTGTAANPGGTAGQTQINAGGSTFIGIPGSMTDATYGWKTQGGTQYAKGWQTGGGNNGIAGAVGASQTVVADPSYPLTEQYNFYSSLIPGAPAGMHVQDLRRGKQTDIFQDWPSSGSALDMGYGYTGAVKETNCTLSRWAAGTAGSAACEALRLVSTIPGGSIGNPTVPPSGGGQWVNQTSGPNSSSIYFGSGITSGYGCTMMKFGVGDTVCNYYYVTSSGGATAPSDEGAKGYGNNVIENANIATGTAAQTYATGATSIKVNTVSGCPGNLTQCYWGTGRYLAQMSTGPTSTNITNLVAGLDSSIRGVSVLDAMPATSNAWGTLQSPVAPPFSSAPPFAASLTFNVTRTGGTGFDTTHLLCFASQFHDCAFPTAATNTAGNTWSITIPVRRPHASGSFVMQGGMAGYGISTTIFNLGSTSGSQRYLIDVLGNIDANTLEVTFFDRGVNASSPESGGDFGADLYGTFNITAMSSNGTTVQVTFSTTTMGLGPSSRNKANYIFSAASYASYNGTVCTNVTFINPNNFSCTMAGLSGAHSATTATGVLANAGGTLYSAAQLWQMAEVIDVQNEALTPPAIDGTLTLEPNILTVSSGNTLTEMNHYASRFAGGSNTVTMSNPYGFMQGVSFQCSGQGCQGGGPTVNGNAMQSLSNAQPDSTYYDAGGPLVPPNQFNWRGPFYEGIVTDHAPAQGAAFLLLQPTTAQKQNPAYSYPLFNLANNSGTSTLNHNPNFGDLGFNTPGILNFAATSGVYFQGTSVTGLTSNDLISFGALTTPAAPTVTALPGAGTLADGTYCYQITAFNTVGETLPSTPETCVALASGGGTGGMRINWTRVSGATRYGIQGRTAGTEKRISILNYFNGIVPTFTDDGTVTPSTALPTTNTTLGYVNNASAVKLNSATTAFTTTIQAPAGQGGNVTVTVTKLTGVSITPAAVTASTCAEQTFNTYTGLATGQVVTVSPPAFLGAHVWIASTRVSATNTLAISFCADATGGTPPSGAYLAMAF